jgi:hypothetical protein
LSDEIAGDLSNTEAKMRFMEWVSAKPKGTAFVSYEDRQLGRLAFYTRGNAVYFSPAASRLLRAYLTDMGVNLREREEMSIRIN